MSVLGTNHAELRPSIEETVGGKEIWSELASIPLFASMAPEDVENLLADAALQHCAEGATLFRQGDPADCFYIVLDGHVEQFVEMAEGRASVVDVLQPGAIFAEIAVFEQSRHSSGARTLDRTVLLAVPAASFLAKLESRFDLLLVMLGESSMRLRILIQQIADLKLKTTAQRLGGFLLGLTPVTKGQAIVRFPYDKKVVARKLGMKPESLSRALSKLRRYGVISAADNVATIADVASLRRYCLEDDGENG